MTGFGASSLRAEDLSVSTEVKTVNNRYLKVSFRVSDGYGLYEPRIENLIREKISRGTVSVSIRVAKEYRISDTRINESLLRTYFERIQSIGNSLGIHTPLSLDQFLGLPGVIQEDRVLSEAHAKIAEEIILRSVEVAIAELQKMRKAEGESMRKDLSANLELLKIEMTAVEELAPAVVRHYRQKLIDRIGKILNENNFVLDPADLTREIALFADKSDVSEEIVRFQSHLVQFADVLEKEDCCGRKLDFLTQEMFRETNTIGSKSNDAEIIKHVIEMKTVIERIREMLQNVE